jgi:predicted DNA-binding transcriptional regulator YafY
MEEKTVILDYTNHKGERRERWVIPHRLYWGSTEYHPEPQWLLEAFDVEKQAIRTFAMDDVHSWN